MKLLPKRRLGIFLMVVSAVFLIATGISFLFFVIKDWRQDTFPKFNVEYPYRILALPLAIIGTAIFLVGLWLALYPEEQISRT